jgi:hypothetical protein
MNKPWIYIASPYAKGDQAINVRFQMKTFDRLLNLDCIPIAPLWTHFQHLFAPRKAESWYAYDNAIIMKCDACVRLTATEEVVDYTQNESTGADAEVKLFEQLKRPVFYNMADLEEWLRSSASFVLDSDSN